MSRGSIPLRSNIMFNDDYYMKVQDLKMDYARAIKLLRWVYTDDQNGLAPADSWEDQVTILLKEIDNA